MEDLFLEPIGWASSDLVSRSANKEKVASMVDNIFKGIQKVCKKDSRHRKFGATTAGANPVDMGLVRAKQSLGIKDGNLPEYWPGYPFPDPDAMKQHKFYDHQIIGAAWLYAKDVHPKIKYPRALIADDMGLGKTLMIVIAIVAKVTEAVTSREYTTPTIIAAPVAVLGAGAENSRKSH